MSIPDLPDILTEADWNKHKGVLAKAAGKTGIGVLMKEMMVAYRLVKWENLDAEAVLEPDDTLEETEAALAEAQKQYKKVPLLLKKIEALEKQARVTQAAFAKNKLIPAASAKHVGRVVEATETFGEEVKQVADELAAFEKARAAKAKAAKAKAEQKPTVKEVVGEAWYAGLAKLTAHRDPAVVRWANNSDIGRSADEALQKINRRFDPAASQAAFDKALKRLRVKLQALKDLQEQRLERAKAVALVQDGTTDLLKLFQDCEESLTAGFLEPLKVIKGRAAPEYATWVAAHADILKMTEQALTVVEKNVALVEALDKHAQKLKGSV